MKKLTFFLSLFVFAIAAVTLTGCDDDDGNITDATLPVNAISFLSEYFPNQEVISKIHDKDEYTVLLKNGVVIDFNNNGDWKEVVAPDGMSLPFGFYPGSIDVYINENYPGQGVHEISKEKSGYFDVELNNGVDLVFTSDGVFVGVDR